MSNAWFSLKGDPSPVQAGRVLQLSRLDWFHDSVSALSAVLADPHLWFVLACNR